MVLSIEVSSELEQKLKSVETELPEILELGLREHLAQSTDGFNGTADVVEFLATLPSPEEILQLKPSAAMQARIDTLLQKSHKNQLKPEEEKEWEQYQYIEHLVRQAKIRAQIKLSESKFE